MPARLPWATRSSAAPGLRDVVAQFNGGRPDEVTPMSLADPEFKKTWGHVSSLDYIAVDAQYFAVALIPIKPEPDAIWFDDIKPIRVGAIPAEKYNNRLMNISCRLDSYTFTLASRCRDRAPFSGFRRPEASVSARSIWPGQCAVAIAHLLRLVRLRGAPMLVALHFFYRIVGNYGISIIMLTVLVRGCMFPVSRRQALSMQKMQALQPEMKRIAEKYKNDAEKRTKAQQELFRQNNANPLGGCLPAILQLPIFVGLYRSLMVDVELRERRCLAREFAGPRTSRPPTCSGTGRT